jgi:hypothetical protein
VRALFPFYAFFFFLFNDLKRERVKRGRNGAEGKRGASEEKTGSVEDGVFSRINNLASNRAEILGFLDMPVPTWETGATIAGRPLDRRLSGRRRRAARRPVASIEAHVDELRGRRATRAARSRAGAALPRRPAVISWRLDALASWYHDIKASWCQRCKAS